MRISLLLRREPFGEILTRTLERFMPQLTGLHHRVTWHPLAPQSLSGRWSFSRAANTQQWLCNFYLNAIFQPTASAAALEPLLREFSRSTVWWRRPIQRAYVALASRPPAARWLAQAIVQITPPVPAAHSLVVVAGNHKLRLLDRASSRSYGILKEGFAPRFIEQELHARQLAAALRLPVPPLERVADDRTWFSEQYVAGTPVNRLAQRDRAGAAVAAAYDALQALYEATRQDTTVIAYARTLAAQIRSFLAAAHLLNQGERQELAESLAAALHMLQAYGDEPLTTTMAHGDFQPANILVDRDRTWLIDWEYASRRQAGYDAFVFALRSRFPHGLAARLRHFVQTGELSSPLLPASQDAAPRSSGAQQRTMRASVFLLEELALHLAENSQPCLREIGAGLAALRSEIRQWRNWMWESRPAQQAA